MSVYLPRITTVVLEERVSVSSEPFLFLNWPLHLSSLQGWQLTLWRQSLILDGTLLLLLHSGSHLAVCSYSAMPDSGALRPFSYFSYSLDIPVERGLLSGTRLLFWVMVESVGNPLTRIQVKQLSSKFREETETFLTVPPRLPPMGQWVRGRWGLKQVLSGTRSLPGLCIFSLGSSCVEPLGGHDPLGWPCLCKDKPLFHLVYLS